MGLLIDWREEVDEWRLWWWRPGLDSESLRWTRAAVPASSAALAEEVAGVAVFSSSVGFAVEGSAVAGFGGIVGLGVARDLARLGGLGEGFGGEGFVRGGHGRGHRAGRVTGTATHAGGRVKAREWTAAGGRRDEGGKGGGGGGASACDGRCCAVSGRCGCECDEGGRWWMLVGRYRWWWMEACVAAARGRVMRVGSLAVLRRSLCPDVHGEAAVSLRAPGWTRLHR